LQPTGHRRWPGAHWPGVRQHTAERATVFVWWVVSRTAEPRLTERRGRGYLNRVGLVSPARFLSTAFRVLGLVPVPAAPSLAAPGQSPASRRKSASAQIQPGAVRRLTGPDEPVPPTSGGVASRSDSASEAALPGVAL